MTIVTDKTVGERELYKDDRGWSQSDMRRWGLVGGTSGESCVRIRRSNFMETINRTIGYGSERDKRSGTTFAGSCVPFITHVYDEARNTSFIALARFSASAV